MQAVANWTYFNCQFTISFGFLFWVYLRRNHAFPLVRNVFIAANAIGLACYTLYPAAPPRMLGSLGFVDTLNETAVNHHSGLIASLANPYAAMPSLHTAYALIVGTSAVMLVRTRVLRVLWAFYPALVVFSIVATANHFFLDAAGGAGVAMLAALAVYAAHTRSRRLAAVLVAAPVASFLVYRFAGRAGQAADTLAAVAAGHAGAGDGCQPGVGVAEGRRLAPHPGRRRRRPAADDARPAAQRLHRLPVQHGAGRPAGRGGAGGGADAACSPPRRIAAAA